MNFYISFLKDVVLPRALDDSTFATLNQLQFFNNVQIISSLTNDADFLPALEAKLSATDRPGRFPPLQLLQELCLIQVAADVHRAAFYPEVVEHGSLHSPASCAPGRRCASRPSTCCSRARRGEHFALRARQKDVGSSMLKGLLGMLTSEESTKSRRPRCCARSSTRSRWRGASRTTSWPLYEYVHELAMPVAGPVLAGTGPMNGARGGGDGDGGDGGAILGCRW